MKNFFLIAEDDEDDRFLLAEAFKKIESVNFDFVENGKELINYLNNKQTPPSLILLDLNMPVMNGWEALKIICKDPELSKIPVVVLTTSRDKADQGFCKKYGAKAFITKPSGFEALVDMLRSATFCSRVP